MVASFRIVPHLPSLSVLSCCLRFDIDFVVIVIFTSARDAPLPSVTLPVMRPCWLPKRAAGRRSSARRAPERERGVRGACIEASKAVAGRFRAERTSILAPASGAPARIWMHHSGLSPHEKERFG